MGEEGERCESLLPQGCQHFEAESSGNSSSPPNHSRSVSQAPPRAGLAARSASSRVTARIGRLPRRRQHLLSRTCVPCRDSRPFSLFHLLPARCPDSSNRNRPAERMEVCCSSALPLYHPDHTPGCSPCHRPSRCRTVPAACTPGWPIRGRHPSVRQPDRRTVVRHPT